MKILIDLLILGALAEIFFLIYLRKMLKQARKIVSNANEIYNKALENVNEGHKEIYRTIGRMTLAESEIPSRKKRQ